MKAKIVIASTLKPVIDPRAYEKIGLSLAMQGEYDVHILGSLPSTEDNNTLLSLHPLVSTRGILERVNRPFKILKHIQLLRPDALIITTHELLFVGTIYKIFYGKKLVYDIQENYYFNLLYQNNYPWGVRHLLAFYVRHKELLLAGFVDHFLLAEQCYAKEIKFIKQRYSIIENKYFPAKFDFKKQSAEKVEFLISGTISEAYGVFDAIEFFKQFPASEYKLIIIGHCPNKQTFRILKNTVAGIENIDFIVSDSPLPHQSILAHIGAKTIGLLPYQYNKSTVNKIPTKLYEYLGLGLPVLISPNPIWDKMVNSFHAGLSIDFKLPINIVDLSKSLALIKDKQQIDLKEISWKYEEAKLLRLFNTWYS